MNELTKTIFKELDLKPDEEFLINNDVYKITEDLKLMARSCTDYNIFFLSAYHLRDLITGKLIIQKIKEPTEDDLAVLKYAKICGAKYVAQDKNGDNYMFIQRPFRSNEHLGSYLYGTWTNEDKDYLQIHAPISFISWDDKEPVCIDKYV